MARRSARIDASGRLVVPVAVRRELEVRDGDEIVFAAGDSPHEVRLMSRTAALERARALVREHTRREGSAVDRLLDERRRDAASEAGDLGRPRRRTARAPARKR